VCVTVCSWLLEMVNPGRDDECRARFAFLENSVGVLRYVRGQMLRSAVGLVQDEKPNQQTLAEGS